MHYNFDELVDRTNVSTGKWEGEQRRLHNPNFIGMGANEMDFKAAPEIIEALHQKVDTGIFGYCCIPDSYYEAIIDYYREQFHWELKREYLHHHHGVWKALRDLLAVISEPGDEIIYQPPIHAPFMRVISTMKRIPVANPLVRKDGQYVFDFEQLESCFTERTKALFLCNPENPTGTVWKRDDLKRISDICLAHNVLLISDDVYNGLVYEGHTYTPIATFSEEAAMNTVTLSSASKTFNLAGLSHAIVIIYDRELGEKYDQMNSAVTSPSLLGVAATEAAFRYGVEWKRQLLVYLQENQRYFSDFIHEHMPEFIVTPAEGLYVAWLDCSCMGLDDQELDDFFEKEAEIGPRHGYAFGQGGKGYMRFNLACPRSRLEDAMQRFLRAYEGFKERKRV